MVNETRRELALKAAQAENVEVLATLAARKAEALEALRDSLQSCGYGGTVETGNIRDGYRDVTLEQYVSDCLESLGFQIVPIKR